MADKMTVAIGSDHAGFALKNYIRDTLTEEGYTVIDCGTDSSASCDYPVYAEKVAGKIKDGSAALAILCCPSCQTRTVPPFHEF